MKPFKKLLHQHTSAAAELVVEEKWILGCYSSYLKQTKKTNCPQKIKELKLWWKGCLRTYNLNKKSKKK